MLSEADIFNLCKDMTEYAESCSHYRVDLHVHSPASHDFAEHVADPAQRNSLRNFSADAFVESLADQGLEVVAITDHNTGTFIDEAIAAAARVAKTRQKPFLVLPGVELTVAPGIHLVAILPDGGTEQIHDLLSELGLRPEDRGVKESVVQRAIPEVAEKVHARHGMLIGAHCRSSKGVVKDLKGQSRIDALAVVDALEIRTGTNDEAASKTIAYVRNDLHCKLPFVYGSDSHDPRSMPSTMWVKMARPDFNGLRQITFEPDLRIASAEPLPAGHPRILGMAATGGLYNSARFLFSPQLNVIIGGRGAGKSAAIDLLRFAFEHEPTREEEQQLLHDRQASFIGNQGEVVVHLATEAGERYAVVRSGAFEKDSKKRVRFIEHSRVIQLTEQGPVPLTLRPDSIFPVEFYGQGEMSRLAERADEQLRLVDDHIGLTDKSQEASDLIEKLAAVELELDAAEIELSTVAAAIAQRPALELALKNLDEKLKDPVFEVRTLWSAEQQFLRRMDKWFTDFEAVNIVKWPAAPVLPADGEKWPSRARLQRMLKTLEGALISAKAASEQVVLASGAARTDIESEREAWTKEFKAAEAAFQERLKEIGARDMTAASEEQKRLQATIREIDDQHMPKQKELQEKIAGFEQRRSDHLVNLRKLRTEVAEARTAAVTQLNGQLDARVRVTLEADGDRSEYVDLLSDALERSGMIRREEQLMALCDAVAPDNLAAALRDKDLSALQAAGLTDSNAAKVISRATPALLRQIERASVGPLVRIQLRREGELVHTDLSGLSVGEKCSAVLSIALLNKQRPLVIDQPEDDLDHAFVTESVVESLRVAKGGRQIIAATHNPNIPVLGDAEMVYRVTREVGNICRIKTQGGLELPEVTAEVQMLEGGPDAFERRSKRYGR